MREILALSTALLFTFSVTYSQVPIGIKNDCNGFAFNGYFDPLTYAPSKKITTVHNSDSYEVGYYYDASGNKVSGLIKFENDKIFFKQGNEEFRDKIRPDEIKHFVIGVDSFFVASNFYYKSKLRTKPEFVQYITEFNGLVFAKHYNFASVFAKQYAMKSPIVESFIVKAKDSTVWHNFSDEMFKQNALKYFSNIPVLVDKITAGEYKSEDILSMIKLAEYHDKHARSIPIYYDKFWQEIKDSKNSKYHAKIVSNEDSIWTFQYFEDTTKLYLANYSSFYPNIKHGEFVAYRPNGTPRQIISFDDNEAQEYKIFNNSGVLTKHYKNVETKDPSTEETSVEIEYVVILDSLSRNIIDSGVACDIIENDSLNKTFYVNTYKDARLLASYKIFEKDTIFKIIDSKYDFNAKSFQKRFDYFIAQKKYEQALSENAQGIILVSLIIDKKGKVQNSMILNKIHPEIDLLVDEFVKTRLLSGAEHQFKFKPYKIDKVKQCCEFVIPIEFSINRFYRASYNYYQFNHNYWMQQQFHQQMMMNSIPPHVTSGF